MTTSTILIAAPDGVPLFRYPVGISAQYRSATDIGLVWQKTCISLHGTLRAALYVLILR